MWEPRLIIMLENLVNEFNSKSLFLNRSSFFHRFFSWNSSKLSSKNGWFFLRNSQLLGIFRKFHFPIVIGVGIFLMGKGAGRSFIVASNKDLGVNRDVSLSLLMGELVTSNRRSFWLPSRVVWVGEAVVTNFW